MENKSYIILRKIPVDKLISLLVDIYNKGVDYVDISGIPGEDCDKMNISFTKEYMTKEAKENLEDAPIDIGKLSEEDLNNLI